MSSPILACPQVASSPGSLERLEALLQQANSGTLEVVVDEVPIVEGYRLERQIGCGRDGIAYDATDVQTGGRVEFRQLAPHFLSAENWEYLRIHVARLSFVKLPAVRRVLKCEGGTRPYLVCEARASTSWRDWCNSPDFQPASQLSIIQLICSALVEANRFGCCWRGTLAEKIQIVESRPQLDLIGLNCTNELLVDNVPVDASFDHAGAAFARFVDESLSDSIFSRYVTERAPRLSAQLRQLISQAKESHAENLPILEDFQACLNETKLLPPTLPPQMQTGSSTEEVLVDPLVPSLDSGTCDVGPIEPLTHLSNVTVAKLDIDLPTRAAPPIVDELRVGDLLGRYRIEAKIGEGGMGAVFRAQDTTDQSVVAIKVLNRAAQLKTQALHRFRKEARVLASLKNPHITNLIEVSEEQGRCYIVLEFVNGIDLHRILKKLGAIPVNVALQIVADIARGLLDAHRRDMIHRDIKPENILIEQGAGWIDEGFDPRVHRARLTDFGIARQVDQSQSLALTQAGGLLGTPLYMSPEQCKGVDVGPQADVYSLGVTLFELLTGRTPFQADETLKLIGMHCYEPAPLVQRIDPRIGDRIGAIVAKCLAKDPADRYADAGHLLEAIDLELQGETSNVQLHPLLPATAASAVCFNEMTWDFDSSPEKLWPYVSNTERVNRAMGLPAVEYTNERDSSGRLRRYAAAKMGGMTIRWEEHPFEWIEGRRMSVLREFDGGPFLWFSSTVELERRPEGGTRLKHSVRMAGRHWLGRMIAKRETGEKCRRTLDAIYTRIERVLQGEGRSASHQDAFEAVKVPKADVIRRVDERLKRMEERGASTELIYKFRDYILHAAVQDLAKIRPLVLGERLCVDERELLDVCLIAADVGLFQMEWDILCPTCRVAADTKASLKELASHTNCEACALDFRSDLANSLELVFRIHRDILDTNVGKYCIGGPSHTPHVIVQVRCEPDERIELPMSLPVGNYLLRSPQWTSTIPFEVLTQGAPSRVDLEIQHPPHDRVVSTLRAGSQVIVIVNRTSVPQILRLERTIPREHVITAAQAMALPGFRALFPSQVLAPGHLISTENVTLLSTRIANIDECYHKLADHESFDLIRRQIETIQVQVRRRRGDVVKIVGEGVLAVFGAVDDAVRAAFEIRKEFTADEKMKGLSIVVGVHRGPAIVTTINSRLDYFGTAARQIQRLPQVLDAGIAMTETVYTDPIVQDFLQTQTAPRIRIADLPNRPQQLIQVY